VWKTQQYRDTQKNRTAGVAEGNLGCAKGEHESNPKALRGSLRGEPVEEGNLVIGKMGKTRKGPSRPGGWVPEKVWGRAQKRKKKKDVKRRWQSPKTLGK